MSELPHSDETRMLAELVEKFVQNELGHSATQDEIDQAVTQVRKMPWSKLMSTF